MDRRGIPVKDFSLGYIKQYIRQNNLKEGDRLPAINELCHMMGVSATSVRETLKTLEAKGVVEIKNGKGSFIKNTKVAELSFVPSAVGEEMQKQLMEIFELRKMLERQIIINIYENADSGDLLKLQNRVDRLMFCYNHGIDTALEDRLFHQEFNNTCHNSLLRKLIHSVLSAFYELYPSYTGFDVTYTDTIPYHEKMVFSIVKRDLDGALAANDFVMDKVMSRLNSIC